MTDEQVRQLKAMANHFFACEDEGEELDPAALRGYKREIEAIVTAETGIEFKADGAVDE